MFSFLLKNEYLGSILAPQHGNDSPPNFEQLKSLVKAGKADEALDLLTNSGVLPDPDSVDLISDKDGLNLLHVASAANALAMVVELVNVRGAKVQVQSSTGCTPLHYAAVNGHVNVIDVLLRYGADPSIPNHSGEIPYDMAAAAAAIKGANQQQHAASARLLLQNRTEIEDKILSPTALFHKRSSELNSRSPPPRAAQQQQQMQHFPSSSSSRAGTDVNPDDPSHSTLIAATETALAMSDDLGYRAYCSKVFSWIAAKDMLGKLGELLAKDPSLALCRTAGVNKISHFNDGFTPLHAAAYYGNCDVIRLLLTSNPRVHSWVRDLQGKTPLHVAAERRHVAACRLLRERMSHDSNGLDPVGEDAPLDLSGRTPLGCYSKSLEDDNVDVSVEMRDALFQPGDRSVLPRSPIPERSGCSPWRTGHNPTNIGVLLNLISSTSASGSEAQAEPQFVYAFSEACGFKRQMEDQVVLQCPIDETLCPSWSLFGVCDGHGGATCSKHLSQRLGPLVLAETRLRVNNHLVQDQPMILREILFHACANAELELRNNSLFRCEVLQRNESTGQPTRIACLNTSGSTGIFCLATLGHLAIANVGDSRAVLAQFSAKESNIPADESSADVSDAVVVAAEGALSPRPDETLVMSVPHNLQAIPLSRDQKLKDSLEQERVVKSGAL